MKHAVESFGLAAQDIQFPPRQASGNWRPFLLAAVVAAAVLRLAFPSGIAVEHFDEGVYASNLACFDIDARYPDQHLYAPPLVPATIEWSLLFFGTGPAVPILFSLACSLALIVILGEMSRRWFGEPTARAVVALAVFSDLHILYSRTALTDVPWVTWLVLGVWLTHRAIVEGKAVQILLAGLAIGLGWWTKYTGWLPLAISLAGIAGSLVFGGGSRRQAGPWLARWVGVAVVTGLAIAPFFDSLKAHGGYAEVAENHARYIIPGLWHRALIIQARSQFQLESLLSLAGLGLAVWLAAGRPWRFTWNGVTEPPRPASTRSLLKYSFYLVGLSSLFSTAYLLAVVAAWALCAGWLASRARRPRIDELDPARSRDLAEWMLAAWWIGLSLTTPLYYPYPRLALPWLVATWLVVGGLIGNRAWSARPPESDSPPQRTWPLLARLAVVTVVLLMGIVYRLIPQGIAAWQPRTAMADIADQVIEAVVRAEPEGKKLIGVSGEPAVFFQLYARGDETIVLKPIGGLAVVGPGDTLSVPVFLLVGPHKLQERGVLAALEDPANRLERLETFETIPSPQVQLNQPPGSPARMQFRLYRWRPPR